jgi:hypothetical protein
MNFQDLTEDEIEELEQLGFHFHTQTKLERLSHIEHEFKKLVKYKEDENGD